MKFRQFIMSGTAACALVGFTNLAYAQAEAEAPAPAPALESASIETVVVSARLRAESIQDAPVAVTALGAEQLGKLFVKDMGDLTRLAPNVTIEPVGALNRTAAVLYSRGIGYSGIDQAIDPSVGVSVDGVFYPGNLNMMLQMYDAESIEIDRGPQGTLFGKNTTGGVIQIRTKGPVQDVYSIDAFAKFGNFGRSDFGGVVNIPLTDDLAFRFAAQSQYSDGYVRNTYVDPQGNEPTPKDAWLSGDDIKTYRASLAWTPTDDFNARLTLGYIKNRSDSAGGQNGSSPAGGLGAGYPVPGDFLSLPAYYGKPGWGFPGGTTDTFTVKRNYPNGDTGDSFNGSLNMSYHLPMFDIVSVTGFLRSRNNSFSDFDNTELSFFETTTKKRIKYFQQEVRLASNDDESPLSWVLGLYYSWYHFYHQQVFSPTVAAGYSVEGAAQNDWTLAPFAQVDYKITPDLTVTGGVRFQSETKDILRSPQQLAMPFTTGVTISGKRTWTNMSYHAGVNYRVDDHAMVYGSFSTGTKSGAFNSRAPAGVAPLPFDFFVNPPASPEKARAFEIGAKTDWLDNRLRLNGAAFWNNYSDLQVGLFLDMPGAPQVLANGANERARGFEVELSAIPVDDLTLTASLGYLDARYTEFNTNLGNLNYKPIVCNKVVVDRAKAGPCYLIPVRAPMWTMRYQVDYNFRLPNDMGLITPSLALGIESTHSTDTNNSIMGMQSTYAMVDGSVTYTDPTGHYTVSLWAKNITDKVHLLSAVPSSNYFTQLYFAEPRTFGINLSIHFDKEAK
ncbi:MAG TPA: TonB-dependent receptor [Rhizomicrobium sp.]|nr:TonB-dependent receptor [Rhizomicrobium sp.]